MGLVIAAIIVVGIIAIAGGGHTFRGLGQDTENVKETINRDTNDKR